MSVKRFLCIILLSFQLHLPCARADSSPVLDALITPKGMALTAFVYGFSSAIFNFLWAFNWEKHAKTSQETSIILQETGGIAVAVETLVFSGVFPLMLWHYHKHHPALKPLQTETQV